MGCSDGIEPTAAKQWRRRLVRDGFAFVQHTCMQAMLEHVGGLDDWDRFADSWGALEPDLYLAKTGRERRRRHAVFTATPEGRIARAPHQAHYQGRQYNRLQGDIQRWFAPVSDEAASSASLQTILEFARGFFDGLMHAGAGWKIEVHQFRIEASAARPGEPTPEGMHRDGVDYVLVLMVRRANVASGTTSIHDPHGRELGSFTLARPFDAALVEDARVLHGITPVVPLDPGRPAYRDVLVVTFKAVGNGRRAR